MILDGRFYKLSKHLAARRQRDPDEAGRLLGHVIESARKGGPGHQAKIARQSLRGRNAKNS